MIFFRELFNPTRCNDTEKWQATQNKKQWTTKGTTVTNGMEAQKEGSCDFSKILPICLRRSITGLTEAFVTITNLAFIYIYLCW